MFETNFSSVIKHRYFTWLTTTFVVALYLVFLLNHALAVGSGDVSPLLVIFIVMETTVIYFLLTRSDPKDKHSSPIAWLFAFLGTFLPLVLHPHHTAVIHEPVGSALMIIGGLLAIASYFSLNNSFGLSPSLRTVKTNGLYRWLRHPMYASYFVIYCGYILLTYSPYNAVLVVALFACLLMRAHFEEQVLRTDETYLAYAKRVRYRVLPFIY